jgi:hypothetical protein
MPSVELPAATLRADGLASALVGRVGPFLRLFDATFTLDDARRPEIGLRIEGEDGSLSKADRRWLRSVATPRNACAGSSTPGADSRRRGAFSRRDVRAGRRPRRARPGFAHKPCDVVTVSADKLGRLANRMRHS